MQIPVLIEPIAENCFRASSGAPWNLQTEAPSRDEAMARLQLLVDQRLKSGAEMRMMETGTDHPLARFAGMLMDDPLLEPWKEAMAEYRMKAEERASTP